MLYVRNHVVLSFIIHSNVSLFVILIPELGRTNKKKKKAEIEAINVFKVLDLDSDVYAPIIIAVPRELQSDVRVTSLLLSRTCIQYFKNEKKKLSFTFRSIQTLN